MNSYRPHLTFPTLAIILVGCSLTSEPGETGDRGVEGLPGDNGLEGPVGPPGISPFAYTDASMTDINYVGGNVAIGTTTPNLFGGTVGTYLTIAGVDDPQGEGRLELASTHSSPAVDDLTGEVVFVSQSNNGSDKRVAQIVGIGTTSPVDNLHLVSTEPGGATKIVVENNGALGGAALSLAATNANPGPAQLELASGGISWIVEAVGAGSFRILPLSGSPALSITPAGDVGIGTGAPVGALDVRGDNQRSEISLTNEDVPRTWRWRVEANGRYQITDLSVNADRLAISPSGDVGIGTITPVATLDVNGTARLKPYSGTEPVACDPGHSGTIALTGAYLMCVCNGSIWRFVRDDQPCTW